MASDRAHTSLEDNVGAAVACLGGLVPTLDAASGTDALAAELSPCIDTRILNRDDDYILSGAVELPVGDETIGVTAKVSDGRVVIELATQGVGIAQAGVASERVTLTTCWRVAAEPGTSRLTGPAETTCSDAVVKRINPSEVVPFSDVVVPDEVAP